MDINILLRDFITLWVVVDPIGTIPIFLIATSGLQPSIRRAIAIRSVLVAAGILMFFLVVGQFLLEAMEISLVSFQIAGGIVLFLFALNMIFGSLKTADGGDGATEGAMQVAVFPIAIPSIAGPGAILAVVLLTDNDRFEIAEQAVTAGLLGVVLFCVMLLLLLANPIHKLIGTGGENIISRVMGIILAALAVDTILTAFADIGWINTLAFSAGG